MVMVRAPLSRRVSSLANHAVSFSQTWLVHPDPTLTLPSAVTASDPAAAGTEPTAAAPAVEYLATLQKHLGVVNVVRFCPKGAPCRNPSMRTFC